MLWTQSDHMQEQQRVQSSVLTGAPWWPTFVSSTIMEEVPAPYCSTVTDPQGADVINEINTSPYYGWVNFYGHGNYDDITIASPYYNQAGGWCITTKDSYTPVYPWHYLEESGNGLDNITNTDDKVPIMYTIACASAWYDNTEDWYTVTEGFTCFNLKGGPVATGNTRIGWVSSSHVLHSWFLNEVWAQNIYIIGEAFGLAKPLNSALQHSLAMNMTLMGSPEMNIWITEPQEFTNISHPLSIPEGGNDNFTVITGVSTAGVNGEWPIVCIYQEDDGFYEFGETDNNGDITFNITINSSYRLWVTANRHDYIPYQWSMIPGLPAPPQNVTLTATPENYPWIEWVANSEPNLVGYNIYKNVYIDKFNQTGYIKQNNDPLTTTSWVDENFGINPQGGATAYYYVTAVDDDPDESEPSETVSTQGFQNLESDKIGGEALIILRDYDGLVAAPNPFNEQVSIKFVSTSTGQANVSIYNIMGQKVAELFDGITAANKVNRLTFNASSLCSGIYFCRFYTSDKMRNQKLVFIK